MLKAIIVDDEKPAIDLLKILLNKNGNVDVIGSFRSSIEAINEIPKLNPDVIFVDIEMHEVNGIELARRISCENNQTEIVFITAHNQYALDAFRVNAIDYLLKPILQEDINNTIKRVLKRVNVNVDTQNKISSSKVICFGSFQVYSAASKHPLRWRTAKSKELFAYFFQYRGKSMAKWKICEDIWPEYSSKKVDVQLHTTIYKIKKTLSEANINISIKFSNGYYVMDLQDIYSDVNEFIDITQQQIIVNEDNFQAYEHAILLYKDNYLEEDQYIWSLAMKELYQDKFIELSRELIIFYTRKHNYDKAVTITKKVLKVVPFNEEIHERLLSLYIKKNDIISFVNHYESFRKRLNNELGVEPCESLKQFYAKHI